MTLPKETQNQINEIYDSVSRYFASVGVSQPSTDPKTYKKDGEYAKNESNQSLTDLQKLLDVEINRKQQKRKTLHDTFIDDLTQEIKYKTSEVEMLKDQLLIMDLKIDGYDTIIQNIDKGIIPLIDEINVAISSVKTAYDNRIAEGCKSDLYWELSHSQTYYVYLKSGTSSYTEVTYICKKNPNVRQDYNYYGAKYYRKPQNQDYGANVVTELLGTISIASTSLAVVSSSSTFKIQVDDKIIDNIDNPIVFSASDLPKIVAFGVTSIVGVSTDLGGSISSGSTIIAHVGIGTTGNIEIGDSVSLIGVTQLGSTVVGFGTTTAIVDNVWDPDGDGPGLGTFISTAGVFNSLIISLPSIGSTINGNFSIGLLENYPSIILDKPSLSEAIESNFTVIRDTQSSDLEFDYTNNPIDPVTIGIMTNNSIGFGHKLNFVNNGKPIGPFQWHEVRGLEFAPEPECGASFARYYPGNLSWPTKQFKTYSSNGTLVSSTIEYANEGDLVTFSPDNNSYLGIGTIATSENNPTFSGCTALQTAIDNAEISRNEIISRNSSKINSLINSSNALRSMRDKFESQAFAILQGRISVSVDLNKLRSDLAALQSIDLSQFEPKSYYFDRSTGKTSSSTIGT